MCREIPSRPVSPNSRRCTLVQSFVSAEIVLVDLSNHHSGGLGLTGGIADVTSLYDCLMAMQNGLADDSILDKYSEVRIKKWKEMIDPISRANFRKIWAPEADTEREEFFQMCRKMENDEQLQKQSAGVSRCFDLYRELS